MSLKKDMLDKNNIPKHIAIIMDGNGRWAKKRKLPRTAGHRKGVQVVEQIIEAAADLGVRVLTLYAFSTENWNRPKIEVSMLLRTLQRFLKMRLNKMLRNGIQLRVMGEIEKFPPIIQTLLKDAQQQTQHNSRIILNLALNYGSRTEIMHAVRKIAAQLNEGALHITELNEATFSKFLYTDDLPDPDLLIRTSGEMRISNFMLWQLSYAELYFCSKLWPDFTKADFIEAILQYQKRERRFGGIDALTTHREYDCIS